MATWVSCERFIRWIYVDQQADRLRGVGLFEGERAAAGLEVSGRDSVIRCAEAGILGAIIGGSGRGSGDVHADAETGLSIMLARLTRAEAALVAKYAVRDEWPDWCEDGARYSPVYRTDAKGRLVPKVIYDENRKPRFCPIEIKTGLARVESARRIYRRWHAAIWSAYMGFCEESERFTEYRVARPAADPEPWRRDPD